MGNIEAIRKEWIAKHEYIKDSLKQKYPYIIEKYKDINGASFIQKNAPIWVCWWQGEALMPDIIRICYESIYRNSGNHPVKLITKWNYTEYVKLPTYILEKVNNEQISLTHLSDIIRMNLLYEYGGYWMDATILMTQPLMKEENLDFFTIKAVPDIAYVADGKWTVYLIGGGKHSLIFDFLKTFLNEYWLNESTLIDYFLIDYMIALAYDCLPAVKKMIDMNDFYMPNIYDLSSMLNNSFDANKFQELCNKAYFHKLSWKRPYVTTTEVGEQTFWGYLYSWQPPSILDNSQNYPKLSFCIPCKNRFQQISRTLWKNLEDNRSQQQLIEFVLVDFGSTDGLKEWIISNFEEDLISGYLRYFYTDELLNWHSSKAKNTAHLLAQNDILVNLDCDNYTGYQGGQYIIDRFVNNRMDIVLHQFPNNLYNSSYGRISVLKKYFYRIGGYDESFELIGSEDCDLYNRLKTAGLLYIGASDHRYNTVFANSKEENQINTCYSKRFKDISNYNDKKDNQSIEIENLVANNGMFGIIKNLYNHLGEEHKNHTDIFSEFSQIKFPSTYFQIPYLVGSIPKVIHQIWGGDQPLPEIYAHLSESWKEHYPEWKYELWDDYKINYFMETHYPQYSEKYNNFPYHTQRWNVIRYMILNKIGGMYIDFDYESIEPIDDLLKDKTCCFAMAPKSHCPIFGKNIIFNNAMMLSTPLHPFMKKIIETVFSENWQTSVTYTTAAFTGENHSPKDIVSHSTGPWMLMELYEQLPEKEKKEIYLIPDKYVTPFDLNQAHTIVHGTVNDELERCLEEAYAVHYHMGLGYKDEQ